jgi:hypothetical protein
VIKKTAEHETDRAGKRLLRSILEPLGWVVNDVEEDYSIDSNVQVFDGKSPNGAWFHVQLKSSLDPDYSADGTFISQSLKMDHARHFALVLRQPMFLLIADVANARLHWTCPQLDRGLLDQIQSKKQNDWITVRVPTAQQLPQNVTGLLSALRSAYIVLANRELATNANAHFAESLVYSTDQEKLRTELQNKSDILKIQRIADLYHSGDTAAARVRADALLRDPDASIEAKFWASVQISNIDFSILVRSGEPQAKLFNTRLEHAVRLQRLTRPGPKPFKFYALVELRAAELNVLAYENFGLTMLEKAHLQRGGDPFLVWRIYARRAWLAKAIAAKYNQCVRLARYAASSSDPWILGRALTNVITALGTYVGTLHSNEEIALESTFSQSALQISKVAAWASKASGDENGLGLVVISSLLVVHSVESDTYKWALETAETIVDAAIREDVLRSIERETRRWKGEEVEGDVVSDTFWQAVQNMAAVLGLDITDENSPLVRALRIAVKDDTPERVLKECEHLLVSRGAFGPLAIQVDELFNMKTACSKVVHCTLHIFHLEDKDLDSAYEKFEHEHCANCKDQKPRPDGWFFSGHPTSQELEFLRKLKGTPFAMRRVDED